MAMATNKLEEHLKCAVCLDMYKDPRRLSCGHVYCFMCLERMYGGSPTFTCPECRAEVQMNCSYSDKKLASIVDAFNSEAESKRCVEHGKLADIFCMTCTKFVCNACCFGGKHTDHQAAEMKEAAQQEQVNMQKERDDILNFTQTLTKTESAVTKTTDDNKNRADELREKIKLTFRKMGDALKQTEGKLEEKLREVKLACEKRSSSAQRQLQDLQESFNDCLRQMDACKDDISVLENSTKLRKRRRDISSKCKSVKVPITSMKVDSHLKVLGDTEEVVMKALKTLEEKPLHVENDTLYPTGKVFQLSVNEHENVVQLRNIKKFREIIDSLAKQHKCQISKSAVSFKCCSELSAKQCLDKLKAVYGERSSKAISRSESSYGHEPSGQQEDVGLSASKKRRTKIGD